MSAMMNVAYLLYLFIYVCSARVVRVERCVGPEGYAQRTSYAINRPGQPTRQLTRTVVIRPARDDRSDDPNLPPTYDQAVTGKDHSVKVEGGANPPTGVPPPQGSNTSSPPPQSVPTAPPPNPPPGPMPSFAPPPFSQVPRAQNTGSFRSYLGSQPAVPPPPGYSQNLPGPSSSPEISRDRNSSIDADDQTRLLM